MEKLKALFNKYREIIAYVFFGGVTTLVNWGTYFVMHTLAGIDNTLTNVVAWILAVLVAYFTNRRWVFASKTTGRAAAKEFTSFVTARLGTFVMELVLMYLAVDVVGPKIIDPAYKAFWDNGMKMAVSVLVLILNYVFSKLFIFKKREK